MAACMVADMLEPVSPSGTGKTLRAFIASRCSSNHAAATRSAFLRSCPSKTLMRRRRWNRIDERCDCSCIMTLLMCFRGCAVGQPLYIDVHLEYRDTKHLLY